MVGKLNFAGKFVPDFKRRVKPIMNLLGTKSEGVWRSEHTEVLNQLMELVFKRLQLGLYDAKKPIKIHVNADENDCSAVLVQGESSTDYRVVQMLGRELTATEAKCSLIEKLLLCAAWAVKRLAQYTISAPQVCIVLPWPEEALCTQQRDLPVRLQAKIVELSAYGCKYQSGEGAWEVQGRIARVLA